ncbi:MAG: PD40 domain-containing protein, partial [Deltaproteobacteria bacterium]|nr:PD40 domain-containing protein [Deltaproteobacteria bacterium]
MGLSEGKSVSKRAIALGVRRTISALPAVMVVGLIAWVTIAAVQPLLAQTAEPVRLLSANAAANSGSGASNGIAVNSDGSIGAFYSDAADLVASDTNESRDIFVRDTNAGTTERMSVGSNGAQANGPSHRAGGPVAINGDGQVVAFYSDANNLVVGDNNGQPDVFVRLRSAGVTQRVSVASDGTQGNGPSVLPSISADGRMIAFQSEADNLVVGDTNHVSDIFVHDRITGITERVCNVQGNKSSSAPAISDDGNVVAFASSATNLVAGDANNFV